MFMQLISVIVLLISTNSVLNLGIIALHEVNPRVITRFLLKNTRNELFENVFVVIKDNKLEVWYLYLFQVKVNNLLILQAFCIQSVAKRIKIS